MNEDFKVVKHLTQPKNVGRMTAPDGTAVVKGICGDTMEMYLMIKFVRLGPSSLHTGRYHFEQETAS